MLESERVAFAHMNPSGELASVEAVGVTRSSVVVLAQPDDVRRPIPEEVYPGFSFA
jgi:hypothetical protein